MGTNNPSEEQLALVEQRIIALADTVVDPGLPMESDSYFDEHGFDLESAAGQLATKIKAWCKNAEGLEPSLEDHPQVRRMARYLLENVDYEILEAPLEAAVLKMNVKGASTSGGSSMAGGSRTLLYVGLVALVVLACVAMLYLLSGDATKPHHLHAPGGGGGGGGGGGSGGGGGGRGGRGGRGWRNDSA